MAVNACLSRALSRHNSGSLWDQGSDFVCKSSQPHAMLDFDGSRRPVWIGAGGAAVGAVFGSSVAVLALGQGEIQHLALFTCILAAFHGLEFFTAAVWREAEVNFNCESKCRSPSPTMRLIARRLAPLVVL